MSQPFVLADDLTGALEAGAAFRVAGWRVLLPLAEDARPGPEPGTLQVFSTETRSATSPQAATAVRRLLDERRRAGARLLFKKIDSTLRGPIGAELSALIEVLKPRLVVVCPANPAAGRTVVQGVVHVDGVALEASDFRHDPAWPADTGDVRARFGKQGVAIHGGVPISAVSGGGASVRACIDELMTRIPATCTLVSDAVSTSDIRMVVRAAIGLVPETIFVGSGALGVVLAEECRPRCYAAVHPIPVAKSMLVLCGSRHPASHRQIEFLSREAGALIVRTEPGESLDTGLRQAMAGLDAGRPVAVKCNPGSVGGPPDAVSAWLAEFARRLFVVRSPDVLYLTGGETATCVCRRLRGRILEVVRELEPGVVLSRLVRGDGADLRVISKPGGYGGPDIMARNFRENTA